MKTISWTQRYAGTTIPATQDSHKGFLFQFSPRSIQILSVSLTPRLYDIEKVDQDQAKMEMETPHSSGVNSPPNAHT
ncbi:hypothetical protein Tco_1392254 [Tanacetum coccineum]